MRRPFAVLCLLAAVVAEGSLAAGAGATDRPLLKDATDRAGRIRDLLVARGPIYETAGDVAIDTDRHNVEQVAVEVMEWYRRRVGAMAGR